MKKAPAIIIGIDVSKSKLDYCIVIDPTGSKHMFGIVSNDQSGITELIRAVKKINTQKQDVLYCFENTGIYSMPLSCALQTAGAAYWSEDALQIKRAKGFARGKNDKSDARDIALYAVTHAHLYKPSLLPEDAVLELKLLLSEREKLVKAIRMFESTAENKNFIANSVLKQVLSENRKTLTALKKQLRAVEKIINGVIASNENLKHQNGLLLSLPGVGPQTAVKFIVETHGFTRFDKWRKFACYCGVAPFEYSSGSSIRGKTKVSHLADKKMKSLLNMAALTAKKTDIELHDYFERKVAEGKNKMLVLNAVRCKIISRAFAVIARGTPFVNTQRFRAA